MIGKQKRTLLFLLILLATAGELFSAYSSDNYKIEFLNIEEVNYNETTYNDESQYTTNPISTTAKVIEVSTLTTSTSSTESYRAVPHIDLSNRVATITDANGNSSTCSVLMKTVINYNYIGTETTWYELDSQKTYIYNRTNVAQTATTFTTTIYYKIDYPNNVLLPNGSSDDFLTLTTDGETDYYMFYLYGGDEVSYYSGNLTDNLSIRTAPEEFSDGSDTYLQIDYSRPSSWTESGFFENTSQNYLEWIISIKAGLINQNQSNEDYEVGLTIESANDFKLKNANYSGSGDSEYPYTLKITDSGQYSLQSVEESDEFIIQNIKDNQTKQFYIYSYSNTSTNNLNAGKYSDNIYLNFITDINPTTFGNKTISVFY